MKKSIRKIVVAQKTFLWQVNDKVIYENNLPIAVSRILIYPEFNQQSKIIIMVKTWDDMIAGNPIKTGYKTNKLSKEVILNLNFPNVIKDIIEYFLQSDWDVNGKGSKTIDDGLTILAKIGYDVSKLYPNV